MAAWRRMPKHTVLAQIGMHCVSGVTVLTGAPISDALRISRAAKRARPTLPVVWGGWHPSMFSARMPGASLRSMSRFAARARRPSPRSCSGSRDGPLAEAAPAAPCGSRMASIHENPARAAGAGRQIPRARLRPDSGRALLRAQGQAAARFHLLAGLQFPLRLLFGSVRLRAQMGGTGAGAHGAAVEGAVGSLPLR